MNSPQNISGFTLIELIVVITIISTMLFFSMPMFKAAGIFQNKSQEIRKLTRLIQSLKSRSVQEDMDFFLHFSLESNTLWITDSSMDEKETQTARDNEIELLQGLRITRIEFPHNNDNQTVVIGFSKKGYSDMAILHMDDGQDLVSLKIEPFLMAVDSIPGHISFNDCI